MSSCPRWQLDQPMASLSGPVPQYSLSRFRTETESFDESQKEKIRSMSLQDMSIQERRLWYNHLDRRLKRPGLKPGLVEKIQSTNGLAKFEILKEFMCDPDMWLAANPIHACQVSGKSWRSRHTSSSLGLSFSC